MNRLLLITALFLSNGLSAQEIDYKIHDSLKGETYDALFVKIKRNSNNDSRRALYLSTF
ncbi:hypothetical protein OOZ15_11960 [Galbibacter sp. EGI 63066]|uniref:hypothetical protein n=1 Tax=Galbibacter sp. EGI 63066 TaxID=2993559 RepID=UPI0022496E1E|nr:hypothetical protein [Galbibacter sp. EGI 63066]MCX2680659.1 hypothetical protein [Galbibacter sp. EGI 63066]